jgi:hypothetical protein
MSAKASPAPGTLPPLPDVPLPPLPDVPLPLIPAGDALELPGRLGWAMWDTAVKALDEQED